MSKQAGAAAVDLTKRLAGKVALITASTDGLGLAMARRFVREGASVSISSRKAPNVERAANELRALATSLWGKGEGERRVFARTAHVAEKDHRRAIVEETAKKFGKIDIFISNAVVNPSTSKLLEVDEAVWEKMLQVNVSAPLELCRLVVPYLQKSPGSSILFNSSIAGYMTMPAMAAYGITKSATIAMSKTLATELAPEIRVNAIAPGVIPTKFSKFITDTPEIISEVERQTPMKRAGTPEEVAGTAAFLVSSDAGYITGETIVIAGGTHVRF